MKYFILILILLGAGGWYYLDKHRQNIETAEFLVGPKEIEVEIADTLPKQIQGLSGRPSLCDDCGMVFTYDNPRFHLFTMKGMNFPLDMIFIENGEIVEIREGVRYPEGSEEPRLIESSTEADMVLEVNSGFARANGLKIGDPAVLTKD